MNLKQEKEKKVDLNNDEIITTFEALNNASLNKQLIKSIYEIKRKINLSSIKMLNNNVIIVVVFSLLLIIILLFFCSKLFIMSLFSSLLLFLLFLQKLNYDINDITSFEVLLNFLYCGFIFENEINDYNKINQIYNFTLRMITKLILTDIQLKFNSYSIAFSIIHLCR